MIFQQKQTKAQNGEWELFKAALVASNRNQMELALAKERNFIVRCRGDSGNQTHERAMGKVSRNDRNWGEEGCLELEEWCFSFSPLFSTWLMGCLCLSSLSLAFSAAQCKWLVHGSLPQLPSPQVITPTIREIDLLLLSVGTPCYYR